MLPFRYGDRVDVVESGCWEWTGSLVTNGYGLVYHDGKQRHAYRVIYELFNGSVPDGYVVDHLCRNRACVNPLHLEAVTFRENVLRGDGMGARYARRTHCNHGHEFTDENTIVRSDGARRCKTCRRVQRDDPEYRRKAVERTRRWRNRQKAES